MERNFENTTAVALAFSENLRGAYARAVVGWAVAIADRSLGWTGKPERGGRSVAVKKLRDKHAYKRDADGTHVLNDKGNKVKLSAVYDVLALADKLCQWLVIERGHLIALDQAARAEDAETLATAVEAFAQTLAELAGGEDKADVVKWLDNELAMRGKGAKAKEEEPAKEEEAPADPVAGMADAGKMQGASFGEIMAWLAQNKGELTNTQLAQLHAFTREAMEQRREELARDLADAAAAA